MKLDQLQRKLLAAARAHPPSDRVPYAFEKRIVAHIAALQPLHPWAFCAPALWRSAAPCLALALLLGVWSYAGNHPTSTAADNEEFSQHFERTMLAAVNESDTEDIW